MQIWVQTHLETNGVNGQRLRGDGPGAISLHQLLHSIWLDLQQFPPPPSTAHQSHQALSCFPLSTQSYGIARSLRSSSPTLPPISMPLSVWFLRFNIRHSLPWSQSLPSWVLMVFQLLTSGSPKPRKDRLGFNQFVSLLPGLVTGTETVSSERLWDECMNNWMQGN